MEHKRLKIGVITSSFPRHAQDGAGIFIFHLVKALEEVGQEGVVVAPPDRETKADLVLSKFTVCRAPIPLGLFYGGRRIIKH